MNNANNLIPEGEGTREEKSLGPSVLFKNKWEIYNQFIDELKPVEQQLKDLLAKYKIQSPTHFIAFGLDQLNGLSIYLGYDYFLSDLSTKLDDK